MDTMDKWINKQKACIDAERAEEVQRCPAATGISYDSYKGSQAFATSLQSAPTAPLRLLQKAGYAVKGLTILQSQVMASSRTPVAQLGRQNSMLGADASGFHTRDIVAILDGRLRLICQGIVVSFTEKAIGVSLEDGIEIADLEAAEPLVVFRAGSDLTFKYLLANMEHFKSYRIPWDNGKEMTSEMAQVRRKITEVLLGERELEPLSSKQWSHKLDIPPSISLNSKQREAVQCMSAASFLSVIWGPAGTGKTTTLSAGVALCLLNNPQTRILVCAPSNTATDNLLLGICAALRKLNGKTDSILRLGSPARATSEAIYPFLFDSRLLTDYASELHGAKTDFQKAEQAYKRIRTKTKMTGDKKALYEARSEFYSARSNMIASQRDCGKRVLATARLVACTLSGTSTSLCLRAAESSNGFDLVLVDEASQALDVSLLGAILLTKGKLVLAGDPNQLPPTVLSDRAMHSKTFSLPFINRITSSLVQKAEEVAPEGVQMSPLVMLEQQYRFCQQICRFPSDEFYLGRLVPDDSVKNISLADFLGKDWFNCVDDETLSKNPTELFVDTCSMNLLETREEGDQSLLPQLSILNYGEADIVVKLVDYFVSILSRSPKVDRPQAAIGCISPYAAQVSLLVGRMDAHVAKGLEISTVDGFQGREKEIIIISFVRSNDEGDVGFLSDVRRLNVSITRAKRLVVIVGNSITLEKDPTLKAYCNHLMSNGVILFPEDLDSWATEYAE